MELPNRPTKDPYQEIPIKDFSYINNPNKRPKQSNHRWIWVVSGLIILVLLGAGAFLYGHYTKSKTTKTTTTTTHKTTAKAKTTTTPNIPLTSYSSATFNLTVSYPTTWAVAAEGTTSMSIISPEMKLTADSGKSVEGKITVTVLNQGQIPAAFGSTSVAVLNSQDVNFTNPTSNQASQTYISFVQYPATTVVGGLDAIYITGNIGYVKDQNVPITDIDQVSPLVMVNFQQCQNEACTSMANLTIDSSMWNSSSFSTPILDILKSFAFS